MGHGLTTNMLLDVWERGLTERPLLRALNLLACVFPEATPEQLRELPVGQRDTRLIEIREALFGQRLICLTACPRCGERLELMLDSTQLRSQPSQAAATKIHALTTSNCEVHFRLPNSEDILLLADLPDPSWARHSLFERCVQQAIRDGIPVAASELPEELVDSVANLMAQIDPQADIQIAIICPACSHQWSTAFDIISYLWNEINTWAMRILRDVDKLARAYGWREADILALSPMRRQLYLELIG